MDQATFFSVYNASAGSGKTFTLVKEYLKIVLTAESAYHFQKILAITFTNKAAAEMKERILENLRSFANQETNDMLLLLSEETGLEAQKIQLRSKRILENILQNYAAFTITTIDSFTHKLIRTFAHDLGLPLNFDVEMDGAKLIGEAVDMVISKIGTDSLLTEVLIDFSLQKVSEDKSWDISKELNSIAKMLLNESDRTYLQILQLKSLEDFKQLEKQLKSEKEKIAALFIEKGQEGMAVIDALGIPYNSFSHSELPNFFKKLLHIQNLKFDNLKFNGRLHKAVSNASFYAKKTERAIQEKIDGVAPQLIALYQEVEQLYSEQYGNYILIDLVLKSLIPLAVVNHIQQELNSIKEQNNIRLSAEFNQLISDKIKREPAPFIYERLGEKFQHYFIDEMQDTSLLQWQNLIPLIDNALSQEQGSLLLVGDAKQAIYRWRGGEAEQFINLSLEGKGPEHNPFVIEKSNQNLAVNYRSFSEIINFNNAFFTHVSQYLTNEVYNDLYVVGNQQLLNANTGGYVQLDFIDGSEQSKEELQEPKHEKVLELITNLDTNFKKSDVCILVRRNREGVAIANYLSENGIEIISSETLLLQNSTKVQFLVALLRFIQNPLNSKAKFEVLSYLHQRLEVSGPAHDFYSKMMSCPPSEFFKALWPHAIRFDFERFLQLPFYESVEAIIRAFKLLDKADAYVQFFLDFVLDFQRKNANDLSAFLELWDLKKDSLSVAAPESENAVRIMSIHKSKGLEFPVVIFPCELDITKEIDPKVWYDELDPALYGDFSNALIPCSSKITYTGQKGNDLYEQRREVLALDSYNLLYVAMTRAVEQLYVVTECALTKKGEASLAKFSGLIISFLQSLPEANAWNPEKLSYCFGHKSRRLPVKIASDSIEVSPQERFISTPWDSHDIEIVSNASKQWGTAQDTAVKHGLLIHEMLAEIYTQEQVASVVQQYFRAGIIAHEDVAGIIDLLKSVVYHPELASYFQKGKVIVTERQIVNEQKQILIPDRLIFDGTTVVILDYKTGAESPAHREQVDKYADVLRTMGYQVNAGILVYLSEKIYVVC